MLLRYLFLKKVVNERKTSQLCPGESRSTAWSSGTVPCRTVYPSARPDLQIRIRPWCPTQERKNSGHQVATVTKVCTIVPNTRSCGSFVSNLLRVALLAPTVSRWVAPIFLQKLCTACPVTFSCNSCGFRATQRRKTVQNYSVMRRFPNLQIQQTRRVFRRHAKITKVCCRI